MNLRPLKPIHLMLAVPALIVGIAVAIGGCNGAISPFLAAQFNTNLPGNPGNAGSPIGGGGVINGDNQIDCFFELAANELEITAAVLNSDRQANISFRILYVVTADSLADENNVTECVGPKDEVADDGRRPGFLPANQDVIDTYLDAGYRIVIPDGSPIGATATFGCVDLELDRGDQLLVLELGSFTNQETPIAPAPANQDPNDPTTQGTLFPIVNPGTGGATIPTPERIVFATRDPRFACTDPTTPCTQESFRYVDGAGNRLIGFPAITSNLIQGTRCREISTQNPSAALDCVRGNNIADFEFPPGATIIWRVLPVEGTINDVGRIRIVWTVANAAGDIVQTEDLP